MFRRSGFRFADKNMRKKVNLNQSASAPLRLRAGVAGLAASAETVCR
jgi:hypothetical protein